MSVEQCAEEIMKLVKEPVFRETDESRAVLAALALQANVRAALRADPVTRSLSFAVKMDGDKVRLSGLVETRDEWNNANRVATAVPGVKAVQNDLRITGEMRKRMGN